MEHDDDTGGVRRAQRSMEHDIDDLEQRRDELGDDIERSKRELEAMRDVTGDHGGEDPAGA